MDSQFVPPNEQTMPFPQEDFGMTLEEAKTECQRWLDYLDRQKESAAAMGRIAGDRRNGKCTADEAKQRVAELDRRKGLTVYDGAKLAEAVKLLIRR